MADERCSCCGRRVDELPLFYDPKEDCVDDASAWYGPPNTKLVVSRRACSPRDRLAEAILDDANSDEEAETLRKLLAQRYGWDEVEVVENAGCLVQMSEMLSSGFECRDCYSLPGDFVTRDREFKKIQNKTKVAARRRIKEARSQTD